jgi:chromosome segregation ATPase
MALLQTEAANNLAKKNLEKALKALRSFERKAKQQAGSSIKIIESWVASKSGRKSELESLANSSAAKVEQLKSKLVDTEDKLAKQVASLSATASSASSAEAIAKAEKENKKASDNLKREIELLKQQVKIATNESNVAEAESLVAQYLFALGTDAINKLRLTNLKNQLALLNRRIVKKTNASTKANVAVSNLKKEIAQQLTIIDNLNNQIKVGSASGLNVHAEAERLAKAHAGALNELKELENAAAEASAEADVQRQSALKSKSVSVYNVYRLLYSSSNSASYMKQWVQQVKRYIEQRQSSLF